MSATVVGVTDSQAVDEKIKEIYLNYMQLMLDCMKDSEYKKDVFANPHKYLNDVVGMTIPEEVAIAFDASKESRHPVIYMKAKDGENIIIKEGTLSLDITDDIPDGMHKHESVKVVHESDIKVDLHEPLKGSDVVVMLPFLDSDADILGEYKFSDNAQIVLSTA